MSYKLSFNLLEKQISCILFNYEQLKKKTQLNEKNLIKFNGDLNLKEGIEENNRILKDKNKKLLKEVDDYKDYCDMQHKIKQEMKSTIKGLENTN